MAEMVPAAFWSWATDKVKYRYPDKIFIGEVYDPNQYRNYIGAGFDYLYDKVGMYDCVRDVICGRRRASDITYMWQATDDIRSHMLYFLENHDEQRIASEFFAGNAKNGIPGLIVSALMQQNPFMVYAGQEFGERGMDKEGFSGVDGRTTIFDYWTVGTLYRGFVNRRKQTAWEKHLYDIYKKVLSIAVGEKAVAEGEFFDLMYVNGHIADKQYAFIRKAGSELLLVVANFSDQPVVADVVIPRHAIDYLHIGEKSHEASDLLSGDKCVLSVKADAPVTVSLEPYGGRIYKINL